MLTVGNKQSIFFSHKNETNKGDNSPEIILLWSWWKWDFSPGIQISEKVGVMRDDWERERVEKKRR